MPLGGFDPIAESNDGWSPVFSIASDSARRVLKIVDWTGGEGTKPAIDKYVGASGLVDAVGDGVDIRGAAGANGSNGSAGAAGSTWHTGSGAPGAGTGANGDYYFRSTTGDVYLKTSGSWNTPIANLTGPTGATGASGGGVHQSVAFIRTSGDDDAGEIGDPTAPYLTGQAAFDDGARSFDLGSGVHEEIVLPNGHTASLYYRGAGPALSTLTLTATGTGSPANFAVRDLGGETATLNLDLQGDNDAPDGYAGSSATVFNAHCGTTLDASGGAANGASSPGSGGALTFERCSIGTRPVANGGAADTGAGGSAGSITYRHCHFRDVAGGDNAAGTNAGDPGSDNGNGGSIVRHLCTLADTADVAWLTDASAVAAGTGGTGGSNGSIKNAGIALADSLESGTY